MKSLPWLKGIMLKTVTSSLVKRLMFWGMTMMGLNYCRVTRVST